MLNFFFCGNVPFSSPRMNKGQVYVTLFALRYLYHKVMLNLPYLSDCKYHLSAVLTQSIDQPFLYRSGESFRTYCIGVSRLIANVLILGLPRKQDLSMWCSRSLMCWQSGLPTIKGYSLTYSHRMFYPQVWFGQLALLKTEKGKPNFTIRWQIFVRNKWELHIHLLCVNHSTQPRDNYCRQCFHHSCAWMLQCSAIASGNTILPIVISSLEGHYQSTCVVGFHLRYHNNLMWNVTSKIKNAMNI